ncbi:GntR family transcriptional regulator [Paenibacillus sacheonensis]|uniref:Substrate-binding domain-containing protein n=1 Tax=Paenibacillus sacheonensis TaxID=742054 RepID=A0A7X5BXA4_9BACL|nr:GntR family transcriptional regulator [Paenibacillus sacheonensis]MBM7568796.1 GntR family transcriptional regulator of arabinose operon [Paenibacillus sacheonensis]NBC68372.1 substrate-binding domain-containing protein [Paenibacillus sacheonensis]
MPKPSPRVPIYKQLQDYLYDCLREAHWKPGDLIPSENELSAQFGVSRITVKKALEALLAEGLVYRIQGKGTFVSDERPDEPVPSAPGQSVRPEQRLVAYLMPHLSNLHTAHLLSGIERELAEHGYRLLFASTHNSQQREKDKIKEMIGLGVVGIIVYPVDGESYNEDILRLTLDRYPLVIVDRYLRGLETNCVCSDNVEGAFGAVSYLIGLGHTRIGLITTDYVSTSSIEDRIVGYDKAHAENRLPIDHRLRLTHFDVERMNEVLQTGIPNPSYREELQQFLLRNPDMTAVFAINASIGATVLDAAHGLGLRIPEDLSVFCYDHEISAMAALPTTCVSQDGGAIGREAAKMLVSVIGDPDQERQRIVVPSKLVVRQSTGPVPS